MNDDVILSALRALAERDRTATASPELETRLRQAFRRRQSARLRKRTGIWSAALVATAAAIVIVFVAGDRTRPEPVMVRLPATSVEAPVAPPPVRPTPRGLARARAIPPHEIVTEFFPLMDVAPPFERGELIRVNVSAAAMRTVGLPVDEDHLADHVQADVLVGQEGLARAIRFVKSSE
ncbi:MAG: hypothetical protein ABSB35_07160 [Bryobacteraceae bacterium]|jgi:hypothetical protein